MLSINKHPTLVNANSSTIPLPTISRIYYYEMKINIILILALIQVCDCYSKDRFPLILNNCGDVNFQKFGPKLANPQRHYNNFLLYLFFKYKEGGVNPSYIRISELLQISIQFSNRELVSHEAGVGLTSNKIDFTTT